MKDYSFNDWQKKNIHGDTVMKTYLKKSTPVCFIYLDETASKYPINFEIMGRSHSQHFDDCMTIKAAEEMRDLLSEAIEKAKKLSKDKEEAEDE